LVTAQRKRDGLGAVVHPELRQDALDVCRDRLRADEQRLSDLVLLGARGEQVEHLPLSYREAGEAGVAPLDPLLATTVLSGVRAIRQPPDPGDELTGIDGLHHVVGRTEEDSRRPVERLRALARDDDDRRLVAIALPQPSRELIATHARQLDVGKDDIRTSLRDELQRLFGTRQTDSRVSRPFEHGNEQGSEFPVVVDDDDLAAVAAHAHSPRVRPDALPPDATTSCTAIHAAFQPTLQQPV